MEDDITAAVVDAVITQTKNQGLFDQFRKDCVSDAPNIPAYENLSCKVENYVNCFLSSVRWDPHLNKNQLRETLRKQLSQAFFVQSGVQQIASQIIEKKKVANEIKPAIEQLVCKCLMPEKRQEVTAVSQRRDCNVDSMNSHTAESNDAIRLMCDIKSYIEPLETASPETSFRVTSTTEDMSCAAQHVFEETDIQSHVTQLSPMSDT